MKFGLLLKLLARIGNVPEELNLVVYMEFPKSLFSVKNQKMNDFLKEQIKNSKIFTEKVRAQ